MEPYVALALETMRLHNPDFIHLNYETFRDLQTEDRDVDYSHLRMANQADWIRLYLLRHFGGIWVDADCIVMRSLQPLLDALGCCHSMAFYEGGAAIGGGLIGFPKGSPHIEMMYDRATYMVKSKDPLSWRALMGANMELVLQHFRWEGFLKLDHKLFYPAKPHKNVGNMLEEGSDEEFGKRFSQPLFTAMLSHNLFPRKLRRSSRETLLTARWLLSYFFRRALKLV